MPEPLLCLCTCPDAASARRLAALLVEARLAACVNILPGLVSVYRWQDAVKSADEVLLVIKTDAAHYAALEETLQREHPYELPELVAVSIAAGSTRYLQWLHAALT
jgi:periplasmic divalent cation tolerance protein